MIIYKNLNGNSDIYAFSLGRDYIDVQFKGGKVYRYSYYSANPKHVEHMKVLATQGKGLNSYIMKNVKYNYVK